MYNGVIMYVLDDGDILNSVFATLGGGHGVKLTCLRSTSCGIWHSLGIEPRSWNSKSTPSTITPRTHGDTGCSKKEYTILLLSESLENWKF